MADTPSGYRTLVNSGRQPATGARRTGSADPKEILSVSIRVRRRPGAPDLPDAAALSATPRSERKILSREEFAERLGASQTDINQVTSFARTQGMTVVESSIARRTVVVSGTVEQMNRAFAVDLGRYQTATGSYRGREGNINIPSGLGDLIENVFGLDNRPILRPHSQRAASSDATTPLTPPQVARLYDFPAGNANGQTIGILEFGGGYKPADIQDYFNNIVHLPMPTLVSIGVDGGSNQPGSAADTEVALDIDVAGSVATGAKLAVYFAPNTVQGFVDAITTAIHDTTNRPSVLSISWGGPEAGWGSAINSISTALQEAAALGIAVLASSGDSGAGMPPNAMVEYPASDPWVAGCGGTTMENVNGTSFHQTAWSGSGGGVSGSFPLPYWQTWAGIPSSANPGGKSGRGVPDIAGNADPTSGYMLILNGAPNGPWGGTSAVAPLYAGLVALLNAGLGEPIGYLNYNIYALAGPSVYNDITSGSNGAYKASTGWDACTGFGSIVGSAMATALQGIGLPPALAIFNGKLYMAWKGIECDDRIFWSVFNGLSWTPQQTVPGIGSGSGVSLAVFNNQLYMAWRGLGADQRIFWSSFNGIQWSAQQVAPGLGTSTGPRIAAFKNALYMAWKGAEGDQRLFWSSFNGSNWMPQQQIAGAASSVGPSLAVFNNSLLASWKGQYGDQSLWFSSFDGSNWTSQKQIPGTASSEGPSLTIFKNALWAAWKGEFSDQRLFTSSFNGANWAGQQPIPGVASSIGPSIAVLGDSLFAVWKGALGDERVWFSSFNGSNWTPQQSVPGVGTSTDLAVGAAQRA